MWFFHMIHSPVSKRTTFTVRNDRLPNSRLVLIIFRRDIIWISFRNTFEWLPHVTSATVLLCGCLRAVTQQQCCCVNAILILSGHSAGREDNNTNRLVSQIINRMDAVIVVVWHTIIIFTAMTFWSFYSTPCGTLAIKLNIIFLL